MKKKYENKRRKTRYKNDVFYRDFRRREYAFIIGKIRKLVNEIPPPYKIREEGTRGRPPSNPRYIITAILIIALFSLSYDDILSINFPLIGEAILIALIVLAFFMWYLTREILRMENILLYLDIIFTIVWTI